MQLVEQLADPVYARSSTEEVLPRAVDRLINLRPATSAVGPGIYCRFDRHHHSRIWVRVQQPTISTMPR